MSVFTEAPHVDLTGFVLTVPTWARAYTLKHKASGREREFADDFPLEQAKAIVGRPD